MAMIERLSEALGSVGDALAGVETRSAEAARDLIVRANRVGLYGCGREGFQMRGFAMRLFHLGFDVGYLGDVTMPALGEGDILVVSSGPGTLATVDAHVATARNAGARVVFITAQPDAESALGADLVIAVPAQTMADGDAGDLQGILPMGSVYEGALFFLFEWLVDDLKRITGETAATMSARHTNME